jgi:hypothetical protein
VLIYAPESKILCISIWCYRGGIVLSINVVEVDDIMSKFYMGQLPIKTKINANIGCVMSLKLARIIKY